MKDKEYYSIKKMIEYCDKCKKYTDGYIFEEFVMNDMAVDAVALNVSQIGELTKNISKDIQIKHKNIQWSLIRGLRNRIVHDYEGIKYESMWDTIQNDLPKLKEDLEKILSEEN